MRGRVGGVRNSMGEIQSRKKYGREGMGGKKRVTIAWLTGQAHSHLFSKADHDG